MPREYTIKSRKTGNAEYFSVYLGTEWIGTRRTEEAAKKLVEQKKRFDEMLRAAGKTARPDIEH